MYAPTDLLWRVNNEYRKRLAQAQTFLDLLEQMILATADRQAHTLEALRYAREQVAATIEDHRNWRQTFYYDSPETKRMVQNDRAVNQALARFSRMRSQHESRFYDLYSLLQDVPRPDPLLTRVPNGDLWTMAEYAIYDLVGFNDYLNEIGQVS
jgi:glutamine synthetase adenylyltransferase